MLNLGWLAMALLAAWCIGRPYGLGPQALIGASIALGSQRLVEFQAGEALNDITGVALILAAAALLVNGYAVARAGAAAGRGRSARARNRSGGAGRCGDRRRAGGGNEALVPGAGRRPHGRGHRHRPADGAPARRGPLGIPMLAAGGYWYARNLIAVGNPIPYVGSLGPISLPAPARDFQLRPDFAVVHYWNDTEVWRDWFGPGLDDSFGTLWPLTLAAVSPSPCWRSGGGASRSCGRWAPWWP